MQTVLGNTHSKVTRFQNEIWGHPTDHTHFFWGWDREEVGASSGMHSTLRQMLGVVKLCYNWAMIKGARSK